jgi:hypothetical protein
MVEVGGSNPPGPTTFSFGGWFSQAPLSQWKAKLRAITAAPIYFCTAVINPIKSMSYFLLMELDRVETHR